MATAVLLVTGFVVLPAKRPIFAIGDNGQLFGTDAEFDQDILRGMGSFLSQDEIVIMTAPLVTMP
jgi:hypothetical protein